MEPHVFVHFAMPTYVNAGRTILCLEDPFDGASEFCFTRDAVTINIKQYSEWPYACRHFFSQLA